jgi:hypothetical protein
MATRHFRPSAATMIKTTMKRLISICDLPAFFARHRQGRPHSSGDLKWWLNARIGCSGVGPRVNLALL